MQRPRSTSALVATLLAALVACAALWQVDYLPTHDGPHHLFAAHASVHLDDPARAYGAFVERGAPITALGYQLPFAALPDGLDWRTKHKLVLTLLLLSYGFGWAALYARFSKRPSAAACLGFGVAFQWVLFMGFFPFVAALGAAWWTLAIHRPTSALFDRRSAAVALGVLVTGVFHIFPAAFAGAALLGMELASNRGRGLARALLFGLPALVLAALVATLVVPSHSVHDALEWPSMWTGFVTAFRTFLFGPVWRWALPWVGVVGALWVALGRSGLDASARAAAAFGAAVAAVSLVAPLSAIGWQFFSPRFAAFGVPLALAVAAAGADGWVDRSRAVASAAVAAFSFASLAWAFGYVGALEEQSAPGMALIDADIATGDAHFAFALTPQLEEPLAHTERTVPYFQPWRNFGLVLSVAHGGYCPVYFGFIPSMHVVTRRPHSETGYPGHPNLNYYLTLGEARATGDARLRDAVVTELAASGSVWPAVSVWGARDDVDAFMSRGYVPQASSPDGLAHWAAFEGCPVSVQFADSAGATRVQVDVGWAPLLEPATGAAYGLPPEGPALIEPRGTPCGRMWLRVFDDVDADRILDPGERTCVGARDGRLVFENRPEGAVIDCTWTPPEGSVVAPPEGSVGPPEGSVGAPPEGSVGAPPEGSVGAPPEGSVGDLPEGSGGE